MPGKPFAGRRKLKEEWLGENFKGAAGYQSINLRRLFLLWGKGMARRAYLSSSILARAVRAWAVLGYFVMTC